MNWHALAARFVSWADAVAWVAREATVGPWRERACTALVDAGWHDGDVLANLAAARTACEAVVPTWAPGDSVPDDAVAALAGRLEDAAAALAAAALAASGGDAEACVRTAVEAGWAAAAASEPSGGAQQPRLSVRASALASVQQHFESARRAGTKLAREHLGLYHTLMRSGTTQPVARLDVLAFLAACACGRADELYLEMPTHVLSSMRGRPCRTRDHASLPLPLNPLHPLHPLQPLPALQPLLSYPAVLFTTGGGPDAELLLAVRGAIVGRLGGCGGLVAPIPTSDTTEQLAVVCDADGRCVVVSTTRGGLMRVGEFRLDPPADIEDADDARIAWMDAALLPDSRSEVVLTWGGTDALRGLPTWSCHAGFRVAALVDADKALFYETPLPQSADGNVGGGGGGGSGGGSGPRVSAAAPADCGAAPNFARHGSQLTLWTHAAEDEALGVRRWRVSRTLLHTASATALPLPAALAGDAADVDVADVWGAPRQYIALARARSSADGGGVIPWCVHSIVEGEVRSEYALAHGGPVHRACMLFVHSRW